MEELSSVKQLAIRQKKEWGEILTGFEPKGDNWFLSDVIEDTDFKGFGHCQKGFYLYLGRIENRDKLQNYLEDLNVILYRTEKKAGELDQKVKKLRKEKKELETEKGREMV